MKKILKTYWLLIVVVGLVIALDQITKSAIRTNIPLGGSWMPVKWLAQFFRFVNWENTGAAFGLFKRGGLVFGILAAIVSIVIVMYFPQIPDNESVMRIAIAMQMGGALGNLTDRIFFGPVTDFIAVGNFPVFNIADSCITVGVGILILALWISEKREKQASLAAQINPEEIKLSEE